MYSVTLLEFLNMGGGEIMIIMIVVLLLFGGKKLPELARGLGKGIRDFKDASEGVKREIHRNINAIDLDNEMKAEEEADARHHPAEQTDFEQNSEVAPGSAVENNIVEESPKTEEKDKEIHS
jgi:sec-independent protein translocase protein TatA